MTAGKIRTAASPRPAVGDDPGLVQLFHAAAQHALSPDMVRFFPPSVGEERECLFQFVWLSAPPFVQIVRFHIHKFNWLPLVLPAMPCVL